MASNFRILTHRDNDNLHLQLSGDFDGNSAHELINKLKFNHKGINKIFIHTRGLRDIHPFGRSLLENEAHKIQCIYSEIVFMWEESQVYSSLRLRHKRRLMQCFINRLQNGGR
jgi:hypothetical protein